MKRLICCVLFLGSLLVGSAGAEKPALKVLLLSGGGYHDYAKLVPYLTNALAGPTHATFTTKMDMDILRDADFADPYDLVIYDLCFDTAPDELIEHALNATRAGKPTVMIHCAVHAFRYSPKIKDWETCCGMRSKVHDKYEPFTVMKLDPKSSITKEFPDGWKTEGDELYQTISIDPASHALLKVKSPQDGREHIVCWTAKYGEGRVFATTLGHDMKTVSQPEYIKLLTNGLLWAAGRLE
jgi:type 1 glutamine amidotransferase